MPPLIQYGLVLTKFRAELVVAVLWRATDNTPHIRVLIAHRLLITSLTTRYSIKIRNNARYRDPINYSLFISENSNPAQLLSNSVLSLDNRLLTLCTGLRSKINE